jgi:hypothetical protein
MRHRSVVVRWKVLEFVVVVVSFGLSFAQAAEEE